MSTTKDLTRSSDARIKSTTTLDKSKILHDSIVHLRDYLNDNITDPETGNRGKARFVMTAYPEHPTVYPLIIVYQSSMSGRLISIGQGSLIYEEGLTVDVLSFNTKQRDILTDEVLYALHNGFSSFSDYKMEFAGIGMVSDTGAFQVVEGGQKKTVHRKTIETRWKIYVI